MNFGVFQRYYKFQSEGLVPNIECGNDKEHMGLIPNVDYDDKIFLYCLECNYKKYPGLEFYKSMLELVGKRED